MATNVPAAERAATTTFRRFAVFLASGPRRTGTRLCARKKGDSSSGSRSRTRGKLSSATASPAAPERDRNTVSSSRVTFARGIRPFCRRRSPKSHYNFFSRVRSYRFGYARVFSVKKSARCRCAKRLRSSDGRAGLATRKALRDQGVVAAGQRAIKQFQGGTRVAHRQLVLRQQIKAGRTLNGHTRYSFPLGGC